MTPESSTEIPGCALWAGPLATRSSVAAAAFGEAVFGLLSHQSHVGDALDRALIADPHLVAAHALRGFGLRTLGRRDLFVDVSHSLDQARESIKVAGATPRELALVESLEAWLAGDGFRAVARLDEELRQHRRDPLLAKIVHAVRFMLGDSAGMRSSIEWVLAEFEDEDPATGYLMGCCAFAREEEGDLMGALEIGRRGLELAPDDSWGHHAIAHVFHERAEWSTARDWLTEGRGLRAQLNNFSGHLAWHEALCRFELGELDEVLELYDREIVNHLDRDYRDLSNASSLLVRLDAQGVDLGDRWETLAENARERKGSEGHAFSDLHGMLALAGAGALSDCDALLRRLETINEDPVINDDARVLRDYGLDLARGIAAWGRGDRGEALRDLGRSRHSLQAVGGSHAQRSVFAFILEKRQEQPL